MRIANVAGRSTLVTGDGLGVDIEKQSSGRFGADPSSLYDDWEAFRGWAETVPDSAGSPFEKQMLWAPVPRPRQVFAIGMNYRDHVEEIGGSVPTEPSVFTKFPSCITGPYEPIPLVPGGLCDWEVELVAVIGKEADHVSEQEARSHLAGLTVGQDISERRAQNAGHMPQFSLAKSYRGFGPTGPHLVTLDETGDPNQLRLGCSVNGETVQDGIVSDLVFSIEEIVSRLSHAVTLYPGDLVFTGTPAGVGAGREPQWFLRPDDVLESWIDRIGTMRNVCR